LRNGRIEAVELVLGGEVGCDERDQLNACETRKAAPSNVVSSMAGPQGALAVRSGCPYGACIVKLEIAMMRVLIQSVDGSAGIPAGAMRAALERITR